MGLFFKRNHAKLTGLKLDATSDKDILRKEAEKNSLAGLENSTAKPSSKVGNNSSHVELKPILFPENLALNVHKRRISTVVDDSHFADFEKDDYTDSDDVLLFDASSRYLNKSGSSDEEDEDDKYEEHTHAWMERDKHHSVSQLSALMGYCGLGLVASKDSLTTFADEALKRTYSLLSNGLKIHRLSATMRSLDPKLHSSVIGEHQVELVNLLKRLLCHLLDHSCAGASPYDMLENNKTLYDRYGRVKDIIGRGAYGVIRIVYPEESPTNGAQGQQKAYAVKELQKRPVSGSKVHETKEMFIDRAISEFIISSTLNNKHVVRTLDLMITLPERNAANSCNFYDEVRISQVMDRTSGGDLFHYCKKAITSRKYLSIDEIDCMVKQITKGLWYIHSHGVAHCDLKLENILLENDQDSVRLLKNKKRCRLNLKISDFGKANVVRTQWDTEEQLSSPYLPIGSVPYMAPEEHVNSRLGVSLLKKDCWALGVLVLILFNIRRSFFYKSIGNQCQLDYCDSESGKLESKCYGAAYLWQTTEPASTKRGRYKDPVFDEYAKNAMVSEYHSKSKEWSVQKRGKFIPIETMFDTPAGFDDPGYDGDADIFEQDDFDLRKFCTYKLLDMNAHKRLSACALLKSDWLASVESCGD